MYCLSISVSVKKQKGITGHFISEIVNNRAIELNSDRLPLFMLLWMRVLHGLKSDRCLFPDDIIIL